MNHTPSAGPGLLVLGGTAFVNQANDLSASIDGGAGFGPLGTMAARAQGAAPATTPRPGSATAAGGRLPDLRIERVPITHPDAARLVEEVQGEYVERYGGRDETPIEPGYFDEPAGAFFVGYLDDVPVATGAWRRRTDVVVGSHASTAEVKRMYVAPQVRGHGLARAMLRHLEETARAAGAAAMVLETGLRQPEAIGLYEAAGYTRIAGFGYYRDAPLSRCYARVL